MRIFKKDSGKGKEFLTGLLNRFQELPGKYETRVREIINKVRKQGDQALVEYTRQFDCPSFRQEDLRVPEEEIELAYEAIERELLEALRLSIRNVGDFHQKQVEKSWVETRANGAIVGQLVRAVERAGLYVPGGQGGETPLVSTVIMGAVPAKVAGVERLVMVSPPNREGKLHPALLVAAKEAGVDEIYRVGSAWAIAALAFGTETIPKVDVICGPGNIFVTLAKKILSGEVGIDLVAGPSEILIIAEEGAPPAWLAADLLAQAEHDPLATAVLLTPSEDLAQEVAKEIKKQLKHLKRKKIAEEALKNQGGIIIVDDLREAVQLANQIAPEHLELAVKDPWSILSFVRHAGAVFLGPFTPEAVGDYVAGANHVLPTMGCARYAQALGVQVFQKKLSLVAYNEKALKEEGDAVVRLAELEGLDAHAQSVRIRLP